MINALLTGIAWRDSNDEMRLPGGQSSTMAWRSENLFCFDSTNEKCLSKRLCCIIDLQQSLIIYNSLIPAFSQATMVS